MTTKQHNGSDVDFLPLHEENKFNLRQHYFYLMLKANQNGDQSSFLSVPLEANDRLSNLKEIQQDFTKETFIRNQDGEIIFNPSSNFVKDVTYYGDGTYMKNFAKFEIDELLQTVTDDIIDVIEYQKTVENKPLNQTEAVPLLRELCGIHHRYNDDIYDQTLLRIVSMADSPKEMKALCQQAQIEHVFNAPMLGDLRHLIEFAFKDDTFYNQFNQEIKDALKETFFDHTDNIAYSIASYPTQNKTSSHFLKELVSDPRFDQLDFSKQSSPINYKAIFEKSARLLEDTTEHGQNDPLSEFNAVFKTGITENIVQYDLMRKSLDEVSREYDKKNDSTDHFHPSIIKLRKRVDKIIENKKIDDELKKAPEKSTSTFRFRP